MKKKPKHKIVYESIKRNIEKNIYPEGSFLPSEHEMCTQFDATRPTIRQALARVENDGYIKRHQGKGSIVQKIHNQLGILSLKGVTKVLGEQGELSTKILKKPVVEDWPADFSFSLTEKEKSLGCINMKRLRLVDGVPVVMDNLYIVNTQLPGFCQKDYEKKSLFGTLRDDYNIDIKFGNQNIRAVSADEHIAKLLQVPQNKALLYLEGTMHTSKPNLRIFSVDFCSTDKYYLYGLF